MDLAVALAGDGPIEPAHLPPGVATPTTPAHRTGQGIRLAVESAERAMLLSVLVRLGWHHRRSAAELGISRFALRPLLRKHGLERPR
jgi:transcriptional regulator of acetoin/glycerol metabolism